MCRSILAVPSGMLAAALLLASPAAPLQAQSARLFAYPQAHSQDRPPVLLSCAQYPTPEVGGAALTRQVAFDAIVAANGRLALPDSVVFLPVRAPLPPASYQDQAVRLARSCVFTPARRNDAPVSSPVRLVVQFPPPAQRPLAQRSSQQD